MKVEVNIDKKYFVTIMATILVIAGAFFVVSYANPDTGVGHDANELSGVCKSDGTGCPINFSVYMVNAYCTGAGSLSLNPTCVTRVCGALSSGGEGGGTSIRYYTCSGSCPTNVFSYGSGQTICNNQLMGRMFINQTA